MNSWIDKNPKLKKKLNKQTNKKPKINHLSFLLSVLARFCNWHLELRSNIKVTRNSLHIHKYTHTHPYRETERALTLIKTKSPNHSLHTPHTEEASPAVAAEQDKATRSTWRRRRCQPMFALRGLRREQGAAHIQSLRLQRCCCSAVEWVWKARTIGP